MASLVPNFVFIEIDDSPIISARPYTDRATGTQKLIPAKQTAWLWVGKRHPIEMQVPVPDRGPYRAGQYLLGGPIFSAGKYRPEYDDRDLQLIPIEEVARSVSDLKKAA